MIWTKRITKLLLIAIPVLFQLHASGQNYVGKSVRLSLFSLTPLEDIRAASDKATAVLVAKTREVAVQVPVKTLEFDRKLMQEHFNENYMESDKYPFAKFKGVIDQQIDFTKNGSYEVTVTGVLSVHGVDKQRSVPGKVTVANGTVSIYTEFKVACADHEIKIPTLVFTKIAESITIKVDGKLNQTK